mgnify:CR=1 FL=1
MREAFLERPHLVDDHPGFIRMEVMHPVEQPERVILVTYWESEAIWKEWYHSHKYREAHKGIPKGLKLIPKSVEISYYHVFCE